MFYTSLTNDPSRGLRRYLELQTILDAVNPTRGRYEYLHTPNGWTVSEADGVARWSLRVEMPGVDPADVAVAVIDGDVSVKTPARSFVVSLPRGADAGTVAASLRFGVLELSVSARATDRRVVPVTTG